MAAPAWVAALPSDDDEEEDNLFHPRRLPAAALPETEEFYVEDDDVQVVNVMVHEPQQQRGGVVGVAGQYVGSSPFSAGTSSLPLPGNDFNFRREFYHFSATETPRHHHQHLEIPPPKRRKSEAWQRRQMRPANFEVQSGRNVVDGELYHKGVGSHPRAPAQEIRGGGCPASHLREHGIQARWYGPQTRECGIEAGRWPASQGFSGTGPDSAPTESERRLIDQAHMNGGRDVEEQYNNVPRPQFREYGGGPVSQSRRGSAGQFREQRLRALEGVPAAAPTEYERLLVSQVVDNNGRYASPEQYSSVRLSVPMVAPRSLERMLTGNTMSEWWNSLQTNIGTDRSPLHWDIIRFCKAYELTPEQIQVRMEALEYVEATVNEIWPTAEVHLFGSTATGLALPWSDIDIVVMSSHSGQKSATVSWQTALGRGLKRHGQCQSLKPIVHAKVPLLKVVFKSGLACDICFDAHNGPRGVPVIRQFMQQYEALRPLCLVLKFFLGQQDLNELYKGGLGSFCLINMIVSHLQKLGVNGEGHDLGALLLSFFTRYTAMHNYRTDVVSTRTDFSASKQAKGWVNSKDPELLAVEDPLDPTSDIAKGSYKIQVVRTKFLKAQRVLLTHWHQENVLGQLVDTTGSNRRPKLQVESCDEIKQPTQKKRKKVDTNVGDWEDARRGRGRRKRQDRSNEQSSDLVRKNFNKSKNKPKNKRNKKKKKRTTGKVSEAERILIDFWDSHLSPRGFKSRQGSKKRARC